jgi:hypothetical protein
MGAESKKESRERKAHGDAETTFWDMRTDCPGRQMENTSQAPGRLGAKDKVEKPEYST